MSIVTLQQLKQELNITDSLGSDDDTLIQRKIDAAQNHIERLVGFQITVKFPEPPAALVEAVCLLAAHWYENREASLVGVSAQDLPFGVWSIVNEFREYSFG